MNAKVLLLLAALTGAAVYGALQVQSDVVRDADTASGPLLPALETRLNDVTRVVIEGGDEPVTLARTEAGWTVAEKSGFPADFARLSDLMAELRQARRVERKTRTEAGFAKLGVLDPDAEGSDSRRVTLYAEDGAELGAVVVGNARTAKGFSQNPVRADREVFVRVAGDEHAWLAAGNLTFDTNAMRWLDTELANVPRDRVQAARFESPGAEPLTLVKPDDEAFEMEPLEVPEGREPKKPLGTSVVLNSLAGLRFDDVRRAADFGWPIVGEPSQVDATLWTDDGLRISVTTIERDDKTWARLAARVVDPAEAPQPPAAEAEPAVAGPPAPEEGGDAATEEPAEDEGPSVDAIAAEAAALNARFDGWVFSIPSWKADAFRKALEDVLAPLPEPGEATDAGDAALPGAIVPDESALEEVPVVDPPVVDPPVVEEPVLEDLPLPSEPVIEDPPLPSPAGTPPPVVGDPPAGAPPTGNGGGV